MTVLCVGTNNMLSPIATRYQQLQTVSGATAALSVVSDANRQLAVQQKLNVPTESRGCYPVPRNITCNNAMK